MKASFNFAFNTNAFTQFLASSKMPTQFRFYDKNSLLWQLVETLPHITYMALDWLAINISPNKGP